MDEFTFIDVSQNPEQLPKLPPGSLNTSFLMDIAASALELAGATPEAVLTSWSDAPGIWPIPPRLMLAGQSPIALRLDSPKLLSILIALHNRCREAVKKYGMGPLVRAELLDVLGAKSTHPLAFTSTEPSEEAANLFSLEFILAVGKLDSKLTVQQTSVTRIFAGKRDGLAELRLSRRNSKELTAEWIADKLYKPRGTVVYGTVDVFDRCLLWAERENLSRFGDTLRHALAWMKVAQDKSLAYDFEQRLLSIEPKQLYTAKVEYGESIFNGDTLNYARDLWVNSGKDDHSAFRDFYEYLVPTYLDDDQFRRLFQTGMVLKEDYNPTIGKRLDAGMLNFSTWFMRMMEVNRAQ